jgi:hypothetical protein
VVGMAATPSGAGYWLVASDGGVFSFGDARFFGSTGGTAPRPIVGMAARATGRGYWMAAADGRTYAYGDAPSLGTTGLGLTGKEVVGIAGRANGYWLVARRTAPPPAPTAPPPPAPTLTTLRPGDRGLQVVALQQRLQGLGFWLGAADGTYGPLTSHAVVAFQKANGLARDGIVGSATARALDGATRPRARSTSGRVIEVDLQRQILLVVRDGRVEWVHDTSTGRVPGTTPVGHWRVTRQIDGYRYAELGVLYRPKYFYGGVAVHGYPSVPPHPASHGCVRVTNASMDWLWASGTMPVGTSVWVY